MTSRQKEYLVWLFKISGGGLTSPFFINLIANLNGTSPFSARELITNLIFGLFGARIILLGLDASGRF